MESDRIFRALPRRPSFSRSCSPRPPRLALSHPRIRSAVRHDSGRQGQRNLCDALRIPKGLHDDGRELDRCRSSRLSWSTRRDLSSSSISISERATASSIVFPQQCCGSRHQQIQRPLDSASNTATNSAVHLGRQNRETAPSSHLPPSRFEIWSIDSSLLVVSGSSDIGAHSLGLFPDHRRLRGTLSQFPRRRESRLVSFSRSPPSPRVLY